MLFGLTFISAALLAGLFAFRRNLPAAAGVLEGAALGMGAYSVLELFVGRVGAAENRPFGKAVLLLGALVPAVLALGLLPGSALYVLLGFSCYAGALIITGLSEALHA